MISLRTVFVELPEITDIDLLESTFNRSLRERVQLQVLEEIIKIESVRLGEKNYVQYTIQGNNPVKILRTIQDSEERLQNLKTLTREKIQNDELV